MADQAAESGLARGTAEGVLAARGVSFAYGGDRWVLSDVSVEFPAGTITAIVGPNGAGKSTLVRVLAGLAEPGRGEVTLGGRALARLSSSERARLLAYIPQRGELAEAFGVRQTVSLGRYATGARSRGETDHVERALERCGLVELGDEPFHRLSVGQQQRATLARALAQLSGTSGGVLLADEPFAALDPRHAGLAAALLREEARQGRAVAVVVHDLTAAARLADRALLLASGGTVAAAGAAGEVLSERALARVFGVAFDEAATPGGRVVAARFERPVGLSGGGYP